MKKMLLLWSFLILLVFFPVFIPAQTVTPSGISSSEGLIRRALEKFRSGSFTEALYDFREIILDSSLADYHGSAYFWITKSYLAVNNLEMARENLDFFLENYSGHPFYEEGYYQLGRIHYMNENYQESMGVFYEFLQSYPDSSFVANSYFWIGECLYNLGHFSDAEKLFYTVVTKYPESYKVEAASYRLSLIDLAYREDVLLDLVKLSHEEYLTSLENFQRRERTYEQALNVYQHKISQLENELSKKAAQVTVQPLPPVSPAVSSEKTVETAVPGPSDEIPQFQLNLLEMKNRTLEIKSFLMELMEEQIQGGM